MQQIIIDLETNTLDKNYKGVKQNGSVKSPSDSETMQGRNGKCNRCLLFKNNGNIIGKLILF